ncbi:MAG: NAD(+)/NADH kinase [Nanoarchaeota archaeon]|nr:NAD(+)/NADH kinase [DPANN group archaeon]MBL7117109.1 NAD(+)/NADH kinase [Nanoarchaeota archaeon]
MKKVAICVKDKSKLSDMRKIVREKGLTFVTNSPDFVVSLGGDGTFLLCEREFPGVPKLLIRDSKICKKCVGDSRETILDFIRMNAYDIKEEIKLEGVFGTNKLVAVNDIIIRNKRPNQAIRLDVSIDGTKEHEEVISDGVLISTPFGSTAYFESITRTTFEEGIGIAFNNPVKEYDPVILRDNQTIKVKLVRGDAHFASDNNPKIYTLKQGDIITVRKAKEKAKIIRIEGFE